MKTGRRLAAIVVADILGFSELRRANEGIALELLELELRLVRQAAMEFEGREVKAVADCVLVEFSVATSAVACAIRIMELVRQSVQRLPDDKRIELRVGIHLGEVTDTGSDLVGEGVSTALRVRDLSEDGGVYFTQPVYDLVGREIPVRIQSCGGKPIANGYILGLYKLELGFTAGGESTSEIKIQPESTISAFMRDALEGTLTGSGSKSRVNAVSNELIPELDCAEEPEDRRRSEAFADHGEPPAAEGTLMLESVEETRIVSAEGEASEPHAATQAAPLPEVEIPARDSSEPDVEELERKRQAAELRERYSDKSPVPIVLSSEALSVASAPASAGNPKYSEAAIKARRESTWAGSLVRFAAMLAIVAVGGAVFVYRQGNKARNPFAEAETARTVEPEVAHPVSGAVAQTQSAAAPEPEQDDAPAEAVNPQLQAMFLERCENDPEFCFRTGVAYLNEDSLEAAGSFLRKACEAGSGRACATMAELHEQGRGAEKSERLAFDYNAKGCERNIGKACAAVGFAYLKGIAGPDMQGKANEAFEKACNANIAPACTELGIAYLYGRSVGRSPARAGELLGKACRMDQQAACDEIKKNIDMAK